jgi:Zn-dependent peptidase ImmA (M78 family)/transcriptional regulator with XRE-family HTH domain
MDTNVIATNLVRIRKERGLSQVAVAEAAGLSRAAYRDIEKGRSTPRVQSLRAIGGALGAPMRELVTPTERLEHVRFRSLKRLKRRDLVLVSVARWLRDYRELEDLLDDKQPHNLGGLIKQAGALRAQGMPAVAAAARAHFGLNEREPVHDVCGLLEAQGIKVSQVDVATDAFLGLSVGEDHGGPAVIVNTWSRLPVEHWIYSAVHELGHLLLHLGSYDVSVEAEDDDQEREAEGFASHFLMPDAAFRREWEDAAGWSLLDRVIKVKRVFRVSWRAVVYRVAERMPAGQRKRLWQRVHMEHKRRTRQPLLKLTEPQGVDESVFQATGFIAGAGREPARLDAHDFQGDRLALLVRRAVEQEAITLSRAAEILELSVEQMRDRAASWLV